MELMNLEDSNHDYVSKMVEEMNNCETCSFIHLLKYYDDNRINLYCYTEGDTDISYYRSKIEPIAQQKGLNIRFESCGNKSNVKILYDYVNNNQRYDKSRILFFMDRDFSSLIEDPLIIIADNVYITDNYSFENDILNEDTFELTMKEVVGLNTTIAEKNNINISTIKKEYILAQSKFIELMQPIMANIISWKKNGITSRGYHNFSIAKNIEINGHIVVWREGLDPIRELYDKSQIDYLTNYNEQQVLEIKQEINNKRLNLNILRGHYFVEFFCKYCNFYKFKGLAQISEKDIPKSISIRAKAPKSLISFIDKTINDYVIRNIS